MTEPLSNLSKDLTAEQFARFRDWIHEHSGIYIEETRVDALRISLVARATRFGFSDYHYYFELLVADETEFNELMNLVTINETSFFRFPAQFDALRDLVIPEVLESKSKAGHQFRVWSAGCSTGEEPYTIAMTLLDSALGDEAYRREVLGTDVSMQALDRAREAVYPARAIANLSQGVVQRWFEPVPGGHRPVKSVRDLVEFSYHNLVKEPYPLALLNNWDVIFCRNVTIYFRMDSIRRVIDNFYESLNPGGYLFVGHSETLATVTDRFESVERGGVYLYRKPLHRRTFPVARRSASGAVPPLPAVGPRTGGARSTAAPGQAGGPVAPRGARPAPGPSGGRAASPDAGTLTAQAQALLEQGRSGEALLMAARALELDERDVGALLVRASAHADAGDFSAAIAEAEAAVAIDPLQASARYVLGIIRQQQGDLAAALREFGRALYVDPEFVLAHFNTANIQRARGNYEEACRGYEMTLRTLYVNPVGSWTAYLGGFRNDLLAKTCERSLIECRRGM